MNVLLRASHVLPLRVAILAAAAAAGALVSLVPGFQAVGLGAVLAACAALAWLMVRFRHDVTRQQLASETLMAVRQTLEAQVEARTADTRDSDARLRSIIDSAVDGIIVIDEKGLVESCNPAAERLFGYPSIDIVGRNISMLMPPPYREEHDGYLQRYVAAGVAHIIGIGREVKGRRRDGTVFPLHLSVGEMFVAGQRKFTGILHDLSDRIALEDRLRSSEARWRAIVQSAVDAIIVIDAHGRIEAFNPAAERLFGYAETDVMGRNVNLLMPSPDREQHDGYLANYLATGQAKIIGTGREVRGLHRDGTTFPLHLSVGEMALPGERKFMGILHDLRSRVRIEEQLRERAALARIGEMAAVIAHEVKNPLAGIRGAIQVIGTRLPPASSDGAVVEEIIRRIDALDELMKDLLLFARPTGPRLAPVDLLPLVKLTADLVFRDPALHRVEVRIAGSAPPVSADAEMLKIVFQNLLMNGAHAMHGQGRMDIDIGGENGSARIAFRDTGPGIPPEIREKVFTAFFTTKSRGSGLGLATAKRMIEAHHGSIRLECPPEGGTTVVVELPVGAP